MTCEVCACMLTLHLCSLHAASGHNQIVAMHAWSIKGIIHTWHAPATGPVLIVAPTSLLPNWARELARFAPSLDVRLHHGSSRTDAAENKPANKRRKVLAATSLRMPASPLGSPVLHLRRALSLSMLLRGLSMA